MHYDRQRKGITDMRPGPLPKMGWGWTNRPRRGVCGYPGCENQHYAKGYCRSHYNINRLNGSPTPKAEIVRTCSVPGCRERTTPLTGHCTFHRRRKRTGISLKRPVGVRGKLNNRWNGGTFEYPNHYEMKKNRKIVLENANYICHFCRGKADRIHHKDLSKDNHSKDNLLPSCAKCNQRHRAKTKTSKFIRKYGATIKEIGEIMGRSKESIWALHKTGKLPKVLIESLL